ncbi:MAG: hypothetical protein LAT67_12515 [Balneolales bacterium]|nr:hypothetical protein [Balneolales bacterium]
MKTLYTVLLTALLTFSSAGLLLAQTTYVVNNTPGAPSGDHVFTEVQDAIDAASDGDIIHIVPSQDSYGSFTVNKSLKISGLGLNPDKQAPILSRVLSITIENNASGSTIEGLWLGVFDIANDVSVSDLTIRYNRFNSRLLQNQLSTVNGLLIQNNLFEDNNTATASITLNTGNNTSNVIITNNIFTSGSRYISAGNQALISHNLFLGGGSSVLAFNSVNNVHVFNNIFFGVGPTGPTTLSVQFTSFQNNLTFGSNLTGFPIGQNNNTGSGNLVDTDPQFVDLEPTNNNWNFTWDPSLEPGSPAIGAGTDGSDLGIFGGSSPFDLTGVPLPLIQTLNLPAVIGTDEDLNVTIQARSGN